MLSGISLLKFCYCFKGQLIYIFQQIVLWPLQWTSGSYININCKTYYSSLSCIAPKERLFLKHARNMALTWHYHVRHSLSDLKAVQVDLWTRSGMCADRIHMSFMKRVHACRESWFNYIGSVFPVFPWLKLQESSNV